MYKDTKQSVALLVNTKFDFFDHAEPVEIKVEAHTL
jgi:hypothetical protein